MSLGSLTTDFLKNSVFWLIFWDVYSFVSLTYKGTYAKSLQVSYEMLTFYNQHPLENLYENSYKIIYALNHLETKWLTDSTGIEPASMVLETTIMPLYEEPSIC